MAQLCVFSLGDYPKGQKGFLLAKADGAVDDIPIDENSYTMLYNVQVTAFAVAKKLGYEIELGVYEDDVFASIDEMDNVMDMDGGDSWGSMEEGFARAIAVREKQNYSYAKLALKVFKKLGFAYPDIPTSELAEMGERFENGFKIEATSTEFMFDHTNLVWKKRGDESYVKNVNPTNGMI